MWTGPNMHKQSIAPILTIYNQLSTLIDPNIHKRPPVSIQTICGNGHLLDDIDDDEDLNPNDTLCK